MWGLYGDVQGLILTPCSGVIRGGAWGPYAVPGILPGLATCKARALPPVLSLAPCLHTQWQFSPRAGLSSCCACTCAHRVALLALLLMQSVEVLTKGCTPGRGTCMSFSGGCWGLHTLTAMLTHTWLCTRDYILGCGTVGGRGVCLSKVAGTESNNIVPIVTREVLLAQVLPSPDQKIFQVMVQPILESARNSNFTNGLSIFWIPIPL